MACVRGAMFFIFLSVCINGHPDTTELYTFCSDATCRPDDDYWVAVIDVILYVAHQTADNGYNLYYTSPYASQIVYGHGACNGTLTISDCRECMLVAEDELSRTCNAHIGGQIQLKDCKLRFENYPFVE